MEPLYKRIWSSVKTYFGYSAGSEPTEGYMDNTRMKTETKKDRSRLESKISDSYKTDRYKKRSSSLDSGLDYNNTIFIPSLLSDNDPPSSYNDSSHDHFHGSGGDFGGGGSDGGWDSGSSDFGGSDFGSFDGGCDCGGGCD